MRHCLSLHNDIMFSLSLYMNYTVKSSQEKGRNTLIPSFDIIVTPEEWQVCHLCSVFGSFRNRRTPFL
ncbi:hypothetical protein C6W23_08970 [Bacillus atrophaeus]|nr:hypothetical protein DX926_19685 [Bacillus atrophaeus]PRR91726.1 hypothetical protein C6W23_08970 [Bacillus atrophaeus]